MDNPIKEENKLPVVFTDTVRLVPATSLESMKKQFSDNLKDGKRSLEVTFAGTHSGIWTGKRSFYLPSEMASGANTFLTPYPKPVLTNHNPDKDPIGRVKAVSYIDTSKYFRQKYGDMVSILHTNTQRKKKVAIARDIVRDVFGKDENYQGLGYLRITAEITDSDAIEKFLDERYLTPSTSFVPTKGMYCSICQKDLMTALKDDEEPCKHYFGDIGDDGTPFFYIPFGFQYDEISNVNAPADPLAKVEKLDLRDSMVEIHPIITDTNNTRHIFSMYKDSLIEIPEPAEKVEDKIEDKEDVSSSEESPVLETSPTVDSEDKDGQEKGQEEGLLVLADWLKQVENNEVSVKDLFGSDGTQIHYGPHGTFPADTKEMTDKSLEILKGFKDDILKQLILDALIRRNESFDEKVEEVLPVEDKQEEEINPLASLLENPETLDVDTINAMIELLANALPGEDTPWQGNEEECPDCRIEEDKDDPKGGSNAGKYKTKGPYCGPSGGAPKGSYPINTKKRAISALAYARNAPNPAGIKKCVCRHYPDLAACSKKDSKDNLLRISFLYDEIMEELKSLDKMEKTPEILKILDMANVLIEKVGDNKEVSCPDCNTKDAHLSILMAQLDAEKAVNKELITSFRDNKVTKEVEKVVEKPIEESLEDKSLENAPVIENPVLTGLPKVQDNKSMESQDPKVIYRDIFNRYTNLKVSGRAREANAFLLRLKKDGSLPAEINFD